MPKAKRVQLDEVDASSIVGLWRERLLAGHERLSRLRALQGDLCRDQEILHAQLEADAPEGEGRFRLEREMVRQESRVKRVELEEAAAPLGLSQTVGALLEARVDLLFRELEAESWKDKLALARMEIQKATEALPEGLLETVCAGAAQLQDWEHEIEKIRLCLGSEPTGNRSS